MDELREIATELLTMDTENKLGSKVSGRRNWSIRIETANNNKYAYAGRFGEMYKRGFMSELVKVICERKIRWFEFTYKKDYLLTLKQLKTEGYAIRELHQ